MCFDGSRRSEKKATNGQLDGKRKAVKAHWPIRWMKHCLVRPAEVSSEAALAEMVVVGQGRREGGKRECVIPAESNTKLAL